MAYDDWTQVIPGEGRVAEVARELLELAKNPGTDVRTVNGGQEFLIPPYLADLYMAPPKPRRSSKKKEEVTPDGDSL